MNLGPLLGVLAAILAITLATIVARAGLSRANRALFAVLVLEALFQAVGSLALGRDLPGLGIWVFPLMLLVAAGLAFSYLAVLAGLATPLVRPLRRRRALPILAGLILAPVTLTVLASSAMILLGRFDLVEDSPIVGVVLLWMFLWLLVASVYGLVAAISAFRRAPKGSPARERASAFVVAFGARDAVFLLAVSLSFLDEGFNIDTGDAPDLLLPLATLLFVPMLAYGILRAQLFDIDLKLKIGIRRGTVVGIILVLVFVAAKVVETYLSRTIGFAAGSVVAGVLLFLVPKLNKIGEKVANTAMPNVLPTPVYVQFKKLEVYRAAVESAQETGGITGRERLSLDRLREKLGLAKDDAAAVEAEVVPAEPAVTVPS